MDYKNPSSLISVHELSKNLMTPNLRVIDATSYLPGMSDISAYDNYKTSHIPGAVFFDIDKIASYTNEDIERLLNDPGIIRNITKIKAIIFNAQKIQKMRDSHHGFSGWLHSHHPQKKKNGSLFLKKLLSLRATR